MRLRWATGLALVAALGSSACGRADQQAGDTNATTLSVYMGLPLQGPGGPDAEAVANGARLALREAGGTVGELVVKLVVLDDSTPASGGWDRERTGENARRVVRDRTAIAYLGDGPSGATAISLPLLNAGGVPQISPTSAYAGFTTGAGTEAGEPERWFPSGRRSFARPVPRDDVQARALAAGLEAAGCRRLHVLDDRDLAGGALAEALAREVPDDIAVVGRTSLGPEPDVAREAGVVAQGDADCAVYTGALTPWAPELFDALYAVDPALRLFGASGVASESFAAELAAGTQARTRLTAPVGVLEPNADVRAFVRRYRATFGRPARSGALYGHAAMRIALAAIERAGPRGDNRTDVGRALFGLGVRRGPLGDFRITPSGDTTSTRYSRLRVRNARLVLERTESFASP